jgi:hypothetical protein
VHRRRSTTSSGTAPTPLSSWARPGAYLCRKGRRVPPRAAAGDATSIGSVRAADVADARSDDSGRRPTALVVAWPADDQTGTEATDVSSLSTTYNARCADTADARSDGRSPDTLEAE